MQRKKIELAEKRHNFLIRRIIRIRRHGFDGKRSQTDNMLSEFQPIRSRAADLELKMHIQLAHFLLLRNREKLNFSSIQVLYYHTEGETAEESTFYITMGV